MHFSNQQRDFSSMSLSEREGIVAYFSMEIAIAPDMPTYSGGLGVLAGDTMRSAADLGLGLCAVTLLHRKGYFQQHLDAQGIQTAADQVRVAVDQARDHRAPVQVDRSRLWRAQRQNLPIVTDRGKEATVDRNRRRRRARWVQRGNAAIEQDDVHDPPPTLCQGKSNKRTSAQSAVVTTPPRSVVMVKESSRTARRR